MKRLVTLAALVVAAAVPAVVGLVGNPSFGADVPVRIPAGAIVAGSTTRNRTPSRPTTTASTPPPAPTTTAITDRRPAARRPLQ